jgi:TonB family protein
MLKNGLLLAACSTVVLACAGQPQEVATVQFCEGANVSSSEPMPTASPETLAPSNIFDLHYVYPEKLMRQRLQGRALVRLTVGETGKIDSVQFLRLEAPFPVKSAACKLLQKVRYDLPKRGFETPDSRTWVMGIRYCLNGCSRVPVYPGFEKSEISITGSYL